jgi:hypothetical protein
MGVCKKCGINTYLSLAADGYGSCLDCGSGTHNPNPAKYATCVCKIGHEPDKRHHSAAALTCSPCAVGSFKVQEADSMGAMRRFFIPSASNLCTWCIWFVLFLSLPFCWCSSSCDGRFIAGSCMLALP